MDLPTTEAEHYAAATEALERCITMLHDQSVRVSDAYLAFIALHEADKKAARQTGSGIQLSVLRKGNHIEIKWTGIKWYGPKNNRFSKWIPITKSAEKQQYSREKLRLHAQEWEIDMVMETEEKMARIRRKAAHVVKGILAIRHAMKVQKADGDAAVDSEEEDSEPQD